MLSSMSPGVGAAFDAGVDHTSNTRGVNVTTGVGVWGSWAIAFDPLPFDVGLITISLDTEGTFKSGAHILDVGIGDASGGGNEQVLIPSLLIPSAKSQVINAPRGYAIPILAPKGASLSVRSKAVGSSSTSYVVVGIQAVNPFGPVPFKRCTAYGAEVFTTAGGTQIDPGTTANTLTDTQVVASTANPIKAAILGLTMNETAQSFARFLANMYVDQGGANRRVGPIHHFTTYTTETGIWGSAIPFPVGAPSGVEIGVQAQCSITGADRLFEAIIYGLE